MPPSGVPPGADSRGMILAIVILILVILGTGILFYQSQEGQVKERVTRDLTAIQTLKGDQIAVWRQDRLYDARVLASSAFFIDGVDHYLTYGDDESKNTILRRLREMNTSPYYDNVLLVDSHGTVCLSLDPSVTSVSPPVIDQVNASLRSGNVTMTDFYRVPGSPHANLDVIAPLIVNQRGKNEPVGAVLLSINPDGFLYPLIQAWPVPSRSAETLLVEREGDHVLYLNELRHQNNTALNLTIPLTQTDLPAVKAVLGTTGVFVGKDYRGVDVISVLGPVPGSPWYMVAKVDTAEAYSSWQSLSALIIILVAITLGGAVIIVGLLWQRRQKYYYQSLYALESERTREELRNRERLEILLHLAEMESAGEQELMDFVLDAGCRLTESPAAFVGKVLPDETIFEIAVWSKPAMNDNPTAGISRLLPVEKAGIWAEAVRKRMPVIVNDHAVAHERESGTLPGHDGVTRYISVPIFEGHRLVMVFTVANRETGYTAIDVDNLTLLAQGVWNHLRKRSADELLHQKSTDLEAAFEEITATDEELRANYEELSRNQQALEKSEASLRRFYDSGLFGVIFWNIDGKITDTNNEFLRITGYTREDLEAGRIDWVAMTPAEFRDRDDASLEELKANGKNQVPFEKEYFRKDGSRVPILIAGAMLDDQRHDGVAFVLNISDLKTARAALDESERKYRNLYHYAQVGLFETSFKDGTVVACNQLYADLAGFPSVEEAIGKDIVGLYVNPEDRTEVGRILRETGFIENHTARFRNLATGKPFWGQFAARFNYEREVAEGTILDITAQKEAEDALRESERRLRESQAMAHLGFWYWDVKTGNVEWSDEVFRIFGLDPKTFTPHIDSILALSPWPEDHQRDRELIQKAMESREPGSYEQRFLRPDNSTGYYYSTFEGRYDEGGNLVLIVGTVLDITERKRADEALRDSEDAFRSLAEKANDGFLVAGPDGMHVFANKRAADITGYTTDELVHTSIRQLVHPEEFERVVKERFRKRMAGEPAPNQYDTILIGKDGRNIPIELSSSKVMWHGKPGDLVVFRDITERKMIMDSLRETNDYLQNLFDYANAPIIVWDPQFRITRFNHAFERLTGCMAEGVLGKPVDILFPPDTRERSMAYLQQAKGGERWETVEIPILRRDGSRRIVLWNSATLYTRDGKTVIATIAQGQDITGRKAAEDEIRSAKVFLDMVIDMSPFAMWISDKEGTVTRVNRSLCQTIKLTADEIVGRYNVLSDTNLDIQGVMPAVKAVFDTFTPAHFSIPWKAAKAGDVDFEGARDMFIEVSLFPILNVRGELTNVVCQWVDVTERKAAEDALQESNEYLSNLFNYANAPIIVWDPQFRITRFNHAFENLTGRTEKEVLGKHLEILFPKASQDVSLEHIRRAVSGERWETVEIPILHVSGQTRIVLWNSANIVDPHGTLISTIAQGYDITDRKAAVDALRQSEEKYRVLFTRMTEGSALHEMVYDPAGNPSDYRILDVNPAFESVLGIKRETVVGKTSREAYSINTPPYLDTYARVAATGQPDMFEEYFAPMKKHFSISVFSPEKGRFATILEDITERKQAEEFRERLIKELEQKNAELERFTYTVSHDLKSPLITIKGFAGLLENDAGKRDPVQLKKDVQRITAAADTMQQLLSDVLELSRIGRVISPPENTPFGTIAKEAVDLLAGPLADRGVWIDIAPDLPVVSVDHARIREVMVNLVENAVKFMGSQQNPVIRIGVETDGITPVFFVRDNGIGIDPRYLERIFNLFERLDSSTHGTGIGLTIVRRIIEVHGGKIWAESEGVRKGTTFRFTLPLKNDDSKKSD
jgi:PAS domain S-box-containing protein